MMVSPSAAGDPGFDQQPVGAGPFKVVDFTNERVVYERFEDYWDPEFAGEFDTFMGRRGRVDPLEALENSSATGGDSNPGGMNDPHLQELLAQITRATDSKERLTLIQEMSCAAIDQGFNPGLWSIAKIWGKSDCLVGFEPPFTPYPEFRGVGIAANCG